MEAPPPGSEQMRAALNDFLLQRKQSTQLFKLLSLLNPANLRAGALAGKGDFFVFPSLPCVCVCGVRVSVHPLSSFTLPLSAPAPSHEW